VAIAGAGTGYSVYSSRQQGAYQQAVANQNADLAEQAARDATKRAKIEESQLREDIGQKIGAQRAAYAAGGVELGSPGSALETVADTAALGEQDVRTLRANAAREAWGYRAQAVGFTAQGRSASYLSRAASVNSLLNFGAGLATGASRGDYYLGKNSGPG
jgi:hypothetical protein